MKRFSMMLLLFAAAGVLTAPVFPHKTQITEITLEQTGISDRTPAYRVTLRADGTATYHGVQSIERPGDYRGQLSPGEFARIAAWIQEQNFSDLKSSADTPLESRPVAIRLRVVRDGKCISISSAALQSEQDDHRFWNIEAIIDGVASEVQWQKA